MTKGQRIKLKREELNISQSDLAKKVGISKQTLYKYENDIVTNIPSDKLEAIAKELHTSPGYLIGWIDEDVFYTTLMELPDVEGKAKELFELYEKATPEIQSAVELLLKSVQPHP